MIHLLKFLRNIELVDCLYSQLRWKQKTSVKRRAIWCAIYIHHTFCHYLLHVLVVNKSLELYSLLFSASDERRKMSRKSLSKKETTIWYLCNSCNCHILAKDRDQHLCSNSETTQSAFIKNKQLYANQLTVKTITEDLREIDSSKLNNLIFLNETIFSLCDLVLGDYVLIKSSDLPNEASVVRSVWPILNQNALNGFVSVTEEGKFEKNVFGN